MVSAVVEAASYCLRELVDSDEIYALLRLRHRVYFEQQGYGPPRPHSFDLTAHDERSRLFGMYQGRSLVGGLRMVRRTEQPCAAAVRCLRAQVGAGAPDLASDALPSEAALSLDTRPWTSLERPELEVGRLVIAPEQRSARLAMNILVAALGAVIAVGARVYLYSCARERAAPFARVAHPRRVFEMPHGTGIEADGFVFPLPTVTALAFCSDSPYLALARLAAAELMRTGEVLLDHASRRRSHASP